MSGSERVDSDGDEQVDRRQEDTQVRYKDRQRKPKSDELIGILNRKQMKIMSLNQLQIFYTTLLHWKKEKVWYIMRV